MGLDEDFWETACGESWIFPEGGPDENKMKFCPYCGKPLEKVPYEAPTPEPKASVDLTFHSDPVPAMLWVEDRYLGITPQTVNEVVAGKVRVKAMATGFKVWGWTYTFNPGDRQTITIGLDKMEAPHDGEGKG